MQEPTSAQSSPFAMKPSVTPATKGPGMRDLGLLVARMGFGGLMMAHGWPKVEMVLNGQTEGFPDPIGLGSTISLYGAAASEFVFPAAVVLGFMTRLAALPVVFTMAIAALVVHGGDPLLMSGGAAKEPALFYGLAFLVIAMTGPGRISLDTKLAGRRVMGK